MLLSKFTRPMAPYQMTISSRRFMVGTSHHASKSNHISEAFKHKTNMELLNSVFVYSCLSIPFIVRHTEQLLKYSRFFMGKRMSDFITRNTIFRQFVGGESLEELRAVIAGLSHSSIDCIIDYSPETLSGQNVKDCYTDLSNDSSSGDETLHLTEFHPMESYLNQNYCDIMKCLKFITGLNDAKCCLAIKLSSFARDDVLEELNKSLDDVKFRFISGSPSLFEDLLSAESLTGNLSKYNFHDMSAAIEAFSKKNDLNMQGELINFFRRLGRIVQFAKQHSIRLMIDAEYYREHKATLAVAIHLMRLFNETHPLIFCTYQCYLKVTYDDVMECVNIANDEKFWLGLKIVRGAYLNHERNRALIMKYDDPINRDYEETTRVVEQVVTAIIKEITDGKNVKMILCTHNEDSINFTVDKLKSKEVFSNCDRVMFAQLYGMADTLTYKLAQCGFETYKYVPYGPLDLTLPYLIRRAMENISTLARSKRELADHLTALKERMFGTR